MTDKHMTNIDWLKDSKSFDAVPDLYDRYRPGYPPELVDSILSLTRIPPMGQILEIGSGTGKATLLFAQKGFSIHCIEPGKNLALVAAQNLRDFPKVTFEHVRFDDRQESPERFDLVMSAQAFHWVNGEVGYPKAARALKPEGYLALFWNMYPGLQGALAEDLERVYQERAPELAGPREACEEVIRQRESAISLSGCFASVTVQRFPWSMRYDTPHYLGLLNTYSDHLRLPKQRREHLFEGVAEVIERHGGSVEKPYLAVLYVAQKAI